ncbi:MAG: hypothetical protein F3743_10675 [Nitrospinae bacterium]|nr:hypothetical protein [Nitrospinota bacterium]
MNKKWFSRVFVLWRKIQAYHFSIFDEKGAALVTSILFATVIGVGALVAMQNMVQDMERGERYTQTREAFYIAEAGIQSAMNYLNYDENGDSPGDAGRGFTEVLANFESDHSDDLNNFDFGGGTYTVTVRDNDEYDEDPATDLDNTIILSSTGVKEGRSITIEAVIQNGIYRNRHAITSGNNFKIEGNPTVRGNLGSIHSNADVIGVSSNVEQGIFAVGECEEGCESGVVSQEIPLANPADFSSYANFILTANGDITDTQGEDVDIAEHQLENWTFSNSGWELEGCSGHGMFYSETDVRVTGNIAKCIIQDIVPQADDSCKQDTVNLNGSRENIALVKLYLSKASESVRVELEQSLRSGLSCDDFVQSSELQNFIQSFENSNQNNRKRSSNQNSRDRNKTNQRFDRKNQEQNRQKSGYQNRAELNNNFFIRNVSFQKNFVPVELAQLLDQNSGQNGNGQGFGPDQNIPQGFGQNVGQCDSGPACDPISGTCCGQCDPNPACVADDPNAIPCCSSESDNRIGQSPINTRVEICHYSAAGGITLEVADDGAYGGHIPNHSRDTLGPCSEQNQDFNPNQNNINLTGSNENIALVEQYLSQIPENYRKELEKSFRDNLDCDEFVQRPDFQVFMSPRYSENKENQCDNNEEIGLNLTGRNENIRVVRRYLIQLPESARRLLQQIFKNGINCDDFVQTKNVRSFIQSENSNVISTEPLFLTLVSEGDILISGNANIQNFKNENHPEEVQNLLFVAAGDIDLDGNVPEPIDGIVTAGEQVSLTANAELNGYVIASDVYEESSMVTESNIIENFTVTYNDLKNPFLNDQTNILSWKQK